MLYTYEASNADGQIIKGELDAPHPEVVVDYLSKRNLVPVSVKSRAQVQASNRWNLALFESITPLDRIFLVRNLSTTIKAGLGILEALDIIIKDAEKRLLRDILEHAKSNLQNGQALSETFLRYKQYFPIFFVGMLKAGESSGKLAETLDEMNVYMTREYDLMKKVRSALAYPAVLLFGSFGVVTLLIGFVVPRLARLFNQAGVQLPFMTRVLIFMGDALRFSLILDIVVAALIVGLFLWFRSTSYGKRLFAALLFRVPLVKDLVKKVALVRFTRTLGSLLTSGATIIEALRLAATATGNEYYRVSSKRLIDEISRGVSLAQALQRYPELYPHFLTSLVLVGERTGTLEKILKTYAEYVDEELDHTLKSLTTIIEPVLLLVMGLIIGTIALSVLLPIYQYIQKSAL